MSFLNVMRRTAVRSTMRGLAPVQGRFYCEKAPETPEQEKPEETQEPEKDPKDLKIEELSKSLAYSLAEADNARKIAMRDVDNAKKYALKNFAKDLLDVADNLDRASSAVTEEESAAHPTVGNLKKGVDMTNHSLHKILAQHGIDIQEVAEGDEFDPQYHEAIFNIPATEGKTPNTIGTIVKKGYNYKARVLRPSQVGVFQE
eukprot:TRINITY_DN8644_c0_g1_i1.p1 TRINITY_DN8644_c0_g1~~TRINITY_DN8644_c0_g1_i1.p1  ORF type:complete len:219 (+),score=72.58 TRINITY_DN8644_c0_g1_i1:52-657(+)